MKTLSHRLETWYKNLTPTDKIVIVLGILLTLITRFAFPKHTLYFLYDQGRDAWKLRDIIQGDLTLIGPTTGLFGFFLGPLWYYVGLPGYIISGGNPYGILLWYIFLGTLSIPLFWILSKKILPQPWSWLCFLALITLPGSLRGSTFVWNPLMSIPLMTGAYLSFLKAKKSNQFLFLGSLLIALTLQSQFAFGIFYLAALPFIIWWKRGKLKLRDMSIAGSAVFLTLIPQILFEIKNKFLLTHNLLTGTTSQTNALTFVELWKTRPYQLFYTQGQQLFGEIKYQNFLMAVVLSLIFLFVIKPMLTKTKNSKTEFSHQLLVVMTFLPMIGYLFWRGNHGYFFDYYITAHFVFLIPVTFLAMKNFYEFSVKKKVKVWNLIVLTPILVGFLYGSSRYINNIILHDNNDSGLFRLETAITQMYEWRAESGQLHTPFLVLAPGYQAQHFEYVIDWLSKKKSISRPHTIRLGDEDNWFLIMEKNSGIPDKIYDDWYRLATMDGKMVKTEKIGIFTLEWWQKN